MRWDSMCVYVYVVQFSNIAKIGPEVMKRMKHDKHKMME